MRRSPQPFLAQVAEGYPRRLESRWNHIRLNQLHILLGRHAGGGSTCPYLRRRCCLFFHPEDETASTSVVGQDQPSVVSFMARIARLELAVAQFVGVPVPQTKEDLVETIVEQTECVPPLILDQPGDQAHPDSAVSRRHSRRYACGDTAAGPSAGDVPGDQTRRDSADAVHRQG